MSLFGQCCRCASSFFFRVLLALYIRALFFVDRFDSRTEHRFGMIVVCF